MSAVKPLVKWPGGKTRMLKHLLPLVPPHRLYVEVFGGGLALLLALPKKRGELVNDTDRSLITLYRCCQRHPDEMHRLMAWETGARDNFSAEVKTQGLTDIERSVRLWVRLMSCFGTSPSSFGVGRETGGGAFTPVSTALTKLHAWRARMDGVSIECLDWQRCLDLYDCPHAFFFLDPPYTGPDISGYAPFTAAEVERLAARLRTLKGRWLLSLNDTPEHRALFKGHPLKATLRRSGAAKKSSGKNHGELIIRDRH